MNGLAPQLSFLALQALNGLSHASTLFLMAAGLTLIFGVTRIVNFAHGSFFMLGALLAGHLLVDWFPAWAEHPLGYAGAMVLGAAVAALTGAVVEWALLRRLYDSPELYQLVATFGLSLALHDAMRWGFGVQEVFAPRFPGLEGAVELAGSYFPVYQILLIVLGPLVWLGLHALLHRTRTGRRLLAATEDRAMLGALGVDARWLMLGAVVLGCGLAGLAGALQLPREPAHLQLDSNLLVETFVVVVTGGLGSLGGAFAAALLIGLVDALVSAWLPQASLVLVFLTMALVLAFRRTGLAGRDVPVAPTELAPYLVRKPVNHAWAAIGLIAVMAGLAALGLLGDYARTVAAEGLILLLFALSLQSMMALAGMVSFGHAAYYGLGAYVAAWTHLHWAWSLLWAASAAVVATALLALAVGPLLVRSAGVYLAMLSLALAQVLWAAASQWVAVSGGDNGLIGLQLRDAREPAGFTLVVLVLAVLAMLAFWRLAGSSLGAALQAVRDAPLRAQASALPAAQLRWRVLVLAAALAGLAGALAAAHWGAVFPSLLSVTSSLDALLALLLGGLHQWGGALTGSAVLMLADSQFGRGFEYWRGALGLVVMLVMVLAPQGLLSWRRQGR